MTTEEPIEFEIEVSAQDMTTEDLDQITRNLLKELRETDVESARLLSVGAAPAGSKAGESVTIGMLVIEVLPAVLPGVLGLVQGWITRGQGRTVKFKGKGIEFEGPPEELQKLLASLKKGKRKK
ncbi:MAG: hypothetical protein ABI621_08910 [Chloroflexota bacterium]